MQFAQDRATAHVARRNKVCCNNTKNLAQLSNQVEQSLQELTALNAGMKVMSQSTLINTKSALPQAMRKRCSTATKAIFADKAQNSARR